MREEIEDKAGEGKSKAPNSRIGSPEKPGTASSRSGSPLSLPLKEVSLSTTEKSFGLKELISPLTDNANSKDMKLKNKKEGFPVGAGMQVVRNLAK